MSLFTQIQSAALQAQGTLAQMMGAPSSGKNVLIDGRSYQGVWGDVMVEEMQRPGGGWSRRTACRLTLTRSQFTAPMSLERKPVTRTDLTPQVTWQVEKVGHEDPLHYVVYCWRAGD